MTEPRWAPSRRIAAAPLWAQALLLGSLLIVVVYWPAFSGRILLPGDIVARFPPWGDREDAVPVEHAEMGDLVTQAYPWRLVAGRARARGEWPLWNPRSLFGEPFLANPQTALLWPVHWLDGLLPAGTVWNLARLVETLFGYVFMALLARELGARRAPALLAATAFSFSAFAVSWQGWAVGTGIRCLPLLLWSVARLRRRAGHGAVALAAVAFTLPVLAGHPQTALYDVGLGVAFACFLVCRTVDGTTHRTRFLAAFVLAGLLALALSAAQLLPTLEWVRGLARAGEVELLRPAPWREAVSWLSRDTRANPNGVGVPIPEGATYVGLTSLLLAPLAWLKRGARGAAAFWTVLAIAAMTAVHGWGPLAFLSDRVAGLRGLPLSRLTAWSVPALALLASFGLSALLERAERGAVGPTARWAVAVSVAGVIGVLGMATALVDGPGLLGAHGLASSWLVVCAASAVLIALVLRPRWSVVAAWTLLAVVLADHVQLAKGHLPAADRGSIYPRAPLFDVLRERTAGSQRIGYLNAVTPPNVSLAYGLEDVGGYDYATRRTADLLMPITGGRWNYFDQVRPEALGHPLLDLLNVRFLVAPRGSPGDTAMRRRPRRYPRVWQDERVAVFENPHALPRAFLVPWAGIRVVTDRTQALEVLADRTFDPRRFVLLERDPARPKGQRKGRGLPPRVGIENRGGHRLVEVKTPTAAILVVSEGAYPGWRVSVDGQAEELLTVDHALQGVALGRGEHVVELVFDPSSVRWGAAISALAVVILLGLGAFEWRLRLSRPM